MSRGWLAAAAGGAVAFLAGCQGTPSPQVPTAADASIFDSDHLRISYFRFDEVVKKEDPVPKRTGASLWVIYSKSWERRFGEDVQEPYALAFPKTKMLPEGQRPGRAVYKGVHPDEDIRGKVQELIEKGLLTLPRISMKGITKEFTMGRYQDPKRGAFFRVISVASDKGSVTVLLDTLVPANPPPKPPPLVRQFLEVEVHLNFLVSGYTRSVSVGVGRD